MDKRVFNDIVKKFLLNKSFKYNSKKRRYIKEFNDSYMKIHIQKSNFSNGYYINYLIFCKDLHSYNEIIDLDLGDLFGRFFIIKSQKNNDLFELDESGNENVVILKENITRRDLIRKFSSYLTVKVIVAFRKEENIKVLFE